MRDYTKSDLACENMNCGTLEAEHGVRTSEEAEGAFHVQRAEILTKEAADRIGRGIGSYVTLECGRLDQLLTEEKNALIKLLSKEIRDMGARLTKKNFDEDFEVFVAGLGNEELTADAIGPKTVKALTATRHLRTHERSVYRELGCTSLSALSTGVLGQTGIETLEIVRGAVRAVRPDLVLIIDALAARSCSRLASTVQLSTEGILPGAGVGNHRAAINRESLGVPVIAIGVPTVVNSATLVYDALQKAGIEHPDPKLARVLCEGEAFFVSPRESDMIAKRVGEILSSAIGEAFTPTLMHTLP